jgi:hypothetical protein
MGKNCPFACVLGFFCPSQASWIKRKKGLQDVDILASLSHLNGSGVRI